MSSQKTLEEKKNLGTLDSPFFSLLSENNITMMFVTKDGTLTKFTSTFSEQKQKKEFF